MTTGITELDYRWGRGLDRGYPIEGDQRGPDSIECTPGILGGDDDHARCFLDYSNLVSGFGFICGCCCHDHEAWLEPAPVTA